MNEKHIRRLVYDPTNPPPDETDWARVDALTEDKFNAAAADPDAPPLSEEDLAEFPAPSLIRRRYGRRPV